MADIFCDATDCGTYADVLVSQLANGDTMAWCGTHFVQMCAAVAESTVNAEADEAAAEALTKLGETEAAAAVFPSSPESSSAGAADRVPHTKRAGKRAGNGSEATAED